MRRWLGLAAVPLVLAGCGIVVFERDHDGADGSGGAASSTSGTTTALPSSAGAGGTGDGGAAAGAGAGGDEAGGGGAGGSGGGGGADQPPLDPFAGGARLAPRVIDGGDGARVFIDFWDRRLATPCTFEPAADGPMRCVPIGRGALFADPACSEPVIRVEECAAPGLATRLEEATCGPVAVEVFAPTRDVVEAVPHHRGANGTCVPMSGGPAALVRATRMELEQLVAGEASDAKVAGDLTARVVRGEDGSHAVTGLGRGAMPCDPTDLGGGPRCLDRVTASMSLDLYADAMCVDDAVVVLAHDACSLPPTLASEAIPVDGGCGSELLVHTLGEALPEVWIDLGQGCSQFAPSGYSFARKGPPAAFGVLPRLDAVPVGTGRLQAHAWGHEGHGWWSSEPVFADGDLGAPCRMGTTVTDGLRCVPETNLVATTAYADPACTIQVVRGPTAHAGCAPPAASRFLPLLEDAGCGALAVSEVWERGDELEEIATFSLNTQTGVCSRTGELGGYRVVAVHPPSALAPMSVVVVEP